MADFNLLAEINLQLAGGAAQSLAKKIEKEIEGLNVKPKITPELVLTGRLAELFPGGNKLVMMRIGFDVSDTQAAKIKDLIKKNVTVKVNFEVTKKTEKGFASVTSAIKNLREELDLLGPDSKTVLHNLSKVNQAMASLNNTKNVKKLEKRDRDNFDRYVERARALQKINEQRAGASTNPYESEFLEFINSELDDIISKYGTARKSARTYAGTNINSAANIKKSFQEVFKTVSSITKEATKANSTGLSGFSTQISAGFSKAKNEALALLKTLEASDPVALKVRLDEIRDNFKGQINDMRQFQKLIYGLEQEKINTQATGADPEVVKYIQQRIDLAKKLRDLGASTADIRLDQDFMQSEAAIINIKSLDKALASFRSKAEKLQKETGISSLFDSLGGKAVSLRDEVNKRLADFNTNITNIAASNAPDAAKQLTSAYNILGLEISDLKNNAKQLDEILKNLNKKQVYYDGADMQLASAATKQLSTDVAALIAQKSGLNAISAFWDEQNQAIENLAQNEQKLKRYIYAIDRLRSSMQFGLEGIQEDYSGVTPSIDKLEKDFQAKLTGGANFDERVARKTLSEESYRIRAKQKINQFIQDAADKFDHQVFENGGSAYSAIGDAFSKQKDRFFNFVKQLPLMSDSFKDIQHNLDQLEKGFRKTFDTAAIQAVGGPLGTVSHAIGLAAKRLTAFVAAALPIYALQSTFFSLASAAGELDTQFTKLEQIFAGDSLSEAKKRTDELSASVLNLGSTYGVSSVEIAKSADILAQANIRGKDLEKILSTVTKARLGPTFGDASQITEAIIASLNQFELEAKDVEEVIGGISQVSAKYAVESDGITKAIRRAGGAFAAAKTDGKSYNQAVAEFVGAFTVLKQETREADETLATSLRNILSRLQRGSVQKYLRDNFKINLLDDQGQFIGFNESILKVTKTIEQLNLKSGDPRFAALVQKLAGSLQSSRLTSLLQDADKMQEVIAAYTSGSASLDRDVNIAFGSLANKIERAKNAILELFTAFGRSDQLKQLVDVFTLLVQTLAKAAKGIVELGNSFGSFTSIAITAVGTFTLFKKFKSAITSDLVQPFLRGLKPREVGANFTAPGLSTGGLVPGAPVGPNIDTEPYMLSKGEYVINRYSVLRYGKKYFDDLNAGKVGYAATGSGPNGMITKSPDNFGFNSLFKIIGDAIRGAIKSAISNASQSYIKSLPKVASNPEFDAAVKDQQDRAARQKTEADNKLAASNSRVNNIRSSMNKLPYYNGDVGKLPTYMQEDLISGYLSDTSNTSQATPKVPNIVGRPFRGNGKLLQKALSDAGLNIPDDAFTRLFSGGAVVDDNLKSMGKFNTKTKTLIARGKEFLNPTLLAHEAGHGLDPILNRGKIKSAASMLYTGDFAEKTKQRLLKRPDLYGNEGSAKFNDKLKTEVRADIIKELTLKASGRGQTFSDRSEKSLSAIKALLEKEYNITFSRAKADSSAQQELSGILDNLSMNNKEETAIGMRLPGKLRAPDYTSEIAIKELQNTIGKELTTSTTSTVSKDKIDFLFPSSKVAAGGGSPPNDPPKPPAGFGGGGFFDKYGKNPTTDVAKAATGPLGKVTGFLNKFGLSLGTVATIGIPFLLTTMTSLAGGSKDAAKSFETLTNVLGAMTAAVATYTTLQYALNKIKTVESVQGFFGNFKEKAGKLFTGGGGGLLSKLKTGGGSLIGNVTGRVGAYLAKDPTAVFKGLGLVVVGATAGLKAFSESLITASQEVIDKSTSEAQVAEELQKQEKYRKTSRAAGASGKVVGGATLGATAGSFIAPGFGTGIGALVGGGLGAIYSLFTDLSSSNLAKGISKLAGSVLPSLETVSSAIGGFFTGMLDGVHNLASIVDEAIGFVAGIGPEDPKTSKNRKNIESLALSNANLNSLDLGRRNKVPLSVDSGKFLRSLSLLNDVKNNGGSDKETKDKVKEQATKLKAAFDSGNIVEQAELLRQAKVSGVDLAKFFTDLDIEFDRVKVTAAAAMSSINEVFLGMQETSKRLTSVIDNVNASTEYFTNLAAGMAGEGNSGTIPAQFFEIMKSGNNIVGPGALDLEKMFAQFSRFNSLGAANARSEYFVNQASRGISGQIASGKINVSQEGGFNGISASLTQAFDQMTANLPTDMADQLNDMFSTYLAANEEELTAAVGTNFDRQKVAGIVDGFAQQFNNGAIDLFQKFSESNTQFKQAMDDITKRRLEYESNIIDIVKSIGDRQKARIEFNNKARGLTNTDLTSGQARGIDQQYLGALLSRSGISGDASPEQLLASYRGLSAADPSGSNPEIQAMKENIKKALEFISSGTNSFSQAMGAFDKVAEKAKKSADNLTDSLLGTDEALLSSFRGQLAYQKVVGAKSGGGMLALNQLSPEERASLAQFIGQNEDYKLAFQKSVGISPTAAASKEAKAVNKEFDKQQAADKGLIEINTMAANNMIALQQTMVANNTALMTLGNQINQFATAANSMAQNLVNIPQNITHTHTFNVSPIQVVFSGANNITGLNDATQKMVMQIVQTQLNQFANNLQSNNKGIVIGPQPSQQSQGRKGR